MNVLIVEDEKLAVRKLTKLLEETAPEMVIKAVTPSIAATVEWVKANRESGESEPDLIFMDIELADGQSFEIFNRVSIQSTVIFTTSYDEYALQAFKVNSIDYLLKPVQQEDLQRSIRKFYELTGMHKNKSPTESRMDSRTESEGASQLHPHSALSASLENILKTLQIHQPAASYRNRFLVKQGGRLLSIEVGEIAFFFTEESISFFKNHQGQKFVVDYRMDEIEQFLDPAHFFRINRGIIVTHNAVTQIQPYYNNRLALTLKPAFEKEVIVSREKSNDFRKWMGK
ncbi:LytTR family DNA-binding domain-containing protein [Dyadobacter sp. Leaf189]|uniref:LytR/AlgR family response regulator transcription factor n=1 Tax=Dyadobacter sp. Leaf189 TaxID=1736295 RepID=UPI0006FC340C|nr:LytTR family DNA-binding domain-containing protein [Dyadobacter sp. Leaf189]KQS27653.1 LytR family transcriptional regulator [Dyadobacter sp. Leaf189]